MKMRVPPTLALMFGLTLAAGIGTAAAAPPAPVPVAPANGASVTSPLTLSWSEVTDPSGLLGYNGQISSSN